MVESVAVAEGLMTVKQAMSFLQVSKSTLTLMLNGQQGYPRLQSFKLGESRQSVRRIPKAALVAYAAELLRKANEEVY